MDYLVVYDIADPRRLRRMAKKAEKFGVRVQKSVFECFLTERERVQLVAEVRGVLNLIHDRFLLLPLPDEQGILGLGIAVPPSDPDFYYVG